MFELIPGFASFLIWEQQSKDTIDFKKVYVDMAGDLLSGLLLSQLVFWYLPNKDGGNKLRVQREDEYWIVKSRDEWWDEVRLAPREVDKCLTQLRAAGIVETRVWKFAGNPTTHIRILPAGFMDCLHAVTKEGRQRPKGKFQRDGRRGRKLSDEEEEDKEGAAGAGELSEEMTGDPLSQKCDNGGFLKSEITNSQKCDNLDLLDVGLPSATSDTSSTETLSETTKENSQTPDFSASLSRKDQKEPDQKGPDPDQEAPWPFDLLDEAGRAPWLDKAERELKANFGADVWAKTKEAGRAKIRERRAVSLYLADCSARGKEKP